MANGHAVDKGWKQNQSKKSWMLPSESESEKPLLQLSYAVIVPKVFANSSSDKCSSLLEIINWKVSGWSWKWALLFRTAYKAKYVQSSRPAVPRQAFFFQDIFLLLLLCSSSPPWPNVPFQTFSSINYPVLLLFHWSDVFFLQIFSNSTKKSSFTCFSFIIFNLYKYVFLLFHHRSLSSKKTKHFPPFPSPLFSCFFLLLTKNLRNLDQNQGSAQRPVLVIWSFNKTYLLLQIGLTTLVEHSCTPPCFLQCFQIFFVPQHIPQTNFFIPASCLATSAFSLIIEWRIVSALLWSALTKRNFTNRLESVTFFPAQIFQLHFPIKVLPLDKVGLQNGRKWCNVLQTSRHHFPQKIATFS